MVYRSRIRSPVWPDSGWHKACLRMREGPNQEYVGRHTHAGGSIFIVFRVTE